MPEVPDDCDVTLGLQPLQKGVQDDEDASATDASAGKERGNSMQSGNFNDSFYIKFALHKATAIHCQINRDLWVII